MENLVVIDGNSILNRAFYGIMGSKMLQTADGTYTNAVYGFLNIMFKLIEDVSPEYLVVSFDLKAPTKRHLMYDGYKANRKGMPEELAQQMPIIKQVLQAMNIPVVVKEGYEADDILGTFAKSGEKQGKNVILLTGDRDSFQLASKNITIRIPRTKAGKTETDNFNEDKIIETYGVLPIELIEVKGLMGDNSDNIPGVPGVGEKTALNLVKNYKTIENLYKKLEKGEAKDIKGKLKENLENNKELAFLSKTLGTIDVNAPIDTNLEDYRIKEWNKQEVYKLFKDLRFNRFIERFDLKNELGNEHEENLQEESKAQIEIVEITNDDQLKKLINEIEKNKIMSFYFESCESNNKELIIKEEIKVIGIAIDNRCYYVDFNKYINELKAIFENNEIKKYSHNIKKTYILLKQNNIFVRNFAFDTKIAAYLLNSVSGAYSLEELALKYLNFDIPEYLSKFSESNSKNEQLNFFEIGNEEKESKNYKSLIYAYVIENVVPKLKEELKSVNMENLFNNIEMPLTEVLAQMQYNGIYIDKEELLNFGETLKVRLGELKEEICNLAGEEFNINSTKQLGEILFEKLKLTVSKKNKSGYSTDVESLEKIKNEHPIVEKILEYRKIMKLNSTYVDGLIPFINESTHRIHTFFHQTVTATGRISSTDPNLQNIPTRTELGKELRKVFKAEGDNIFVDADYSQIELRVLSHMSNDEIMIEAFNHDEDIHKWAASKVFDIPLEEVTKELRSKAKAVNFGIVYGISDFGLAEQLGISRKEASGYIKQYLDKYHGIREYMDKIIEESKEKGYIETLYGRRRYIPELASKNYMVRKFGERAAMNTPIQGTAADIMKIAMINVYKDLKNNNMKAKIILQIHDELLIETPNDELEKVKEILISNMQNVIKLSVPLNAELEVGKTWYDAK